MGEFLKATQKVCKRCKYHMTITGCGAGVVACNYLDITGHRRLEPGQDATLCNKYQPGKAVTVEENDEIIATR